MSLFKNHPVIDNLINKDLAGNEDFAYALVEPDSIKNTWSTNPYWSRFETALINYSIDQGWSVESILYSYHYHYHSSHCHDYHMRCPHGWVLEISVPEDLLLIAPSNSEDVIVFAVMAQVIKWCACSHPDYDPTPLNYPSQNTFVPASKSVSKKNPKDDLEALIPGMSLVVRCPANKRPVLHCDKSGVIGWLVIHLNDSHKWSFDRIAHWLESLDVDLTFQPSSRGD
jgi:hypothetical protein